MGRDGIIPGDSNRFCAIVLHNDDDDGWDGFNVCYRKCIGNICFNRIFWNLNAMMWERSMTYEMVYTPSYIWNMILCC